MFFSDYLGPTFAVTLFVGRNCLVALHFPANLLTTRSDSFVAHFRVRSFRQNPETGIWDATDPSAIVDERRFVMLIDRSNVNEPGDQPDILFLEEAPN